MPHLRTTKRQNKRADKKRPKVSSGLHKNARKGAKSISWKDGWQPIKTAPKDGSDILTWAKEGGPLVGNYMFHIEDGLPTWRDDGFHPRFWMPIPSLPRAG